MQKKKTSTLIPTLFHNNAEVSLEKKEKLRDIKEWVNQESISELYHENSKDTVAKSYLSDTPQYEVDIRTSMLNDLVPYKTYPNTKHIALPSDPIPSMYAFDEIIQKRRSIRDFLDEPLELATLSQILQHANGITLKHEKSFVAFRASPSAGALYPVEIYPMIFNIEDVEPGVYHYNARDHNLEQLFLGNFSEQMYPLVQTQEMILDCAVALILTGIFFREKIKYGERGYRFVLLDCGHITQNIYLSATSLDIGCCTIGGFVDDEVSNLIGVDGINESPLYIALLGKPDFEKMARMAEE